jgi:hypothetical protein
MKIISLIAENVKRLTAVEITPDGNVVQITGRNRQGKTSVLDSIWWAICGAEHIQKAPIHKGASEARIRLDLGEIKVTRTFRRKSEGDGFTTSLIVESADGARFPSAQSVLDKLIGELSFDPLAFARMKPKDQFDELRRFVPGVDFELIDRQNKGDYERRTEINRFARQERAAADAIAVPDGTPEDVIDKSALVKQLEKAGQDNEQLVQRRSNRERLGNEGAAHRAKAREFRDEVDTLRKRIEVLESAATDRDKQAEEIAERLKSAETLPPAVDTAPIMKAIAAADAQNDNVRKAADKTKRVQRAKQLEDEAAQLTQSMEARTAKKLEAIAAAKMPIDGLNFGEGIVLLNGVPFDQGSDAEQLEASIAIAAALNPKLRVIRIRDGSLLDDLAMKRLEKLADSLDLQIWIERVDGSGKVGFVIEDGHLKETAGAAA